MKKSMLGLYSFGMMAAMGLMFSPTVDADEAVGSPSTSTAEFTIDPTQLGTLELVSVPSFNFGNIAGASVYSGFSDLAAITAGSVVISDTRLGSPDWTLSATMDNFDNGTSPLSGASINLSATGSLGGSLAGTILDTGAAVTLATNTGASGVNTFNIDVADAKLSLAPNPNAVFEASDVYQSTITWALTSTTPSVPAT